MRPQLQPVIAAAKAFLFACAGAAAFGLAKGAPAARVYDLCVGTAGLFGRVLNRPAGYWRLTTLGDVRYPILQHMLCVATRHGGVALRVRTEDNGLLEETFRRHRRILLCTAHLGLTMAIQRVLFERNIPLCILGRPPRADGLHWGCPRPAPILHSDAKCLIRARRVLAQGHALLAYPDFQEQVGDEKTLYIRSNLFEFAAHAGTPVLFFDAVLEPDGAIAVRVERPVHDSPHDGREALLLAEEFCAFLHARTGRPYRLEPRRRAAGTQPSILNR